MENKQDKPRFFEIKHKACNNKFTINSNTFLNSSRKDLKCSHCGIDLFENVFIPNELGDPHKAIDVFKYFLETYNDIDKALGASTIKEIQPEPKPPK